MEFGVTSGRGLGHRTHQQLLLDAAAAEFAEHGPDGARIARIATGAGVNKERIYRHFGNKDQLFAAVLASELAKPAAAVPLTAEQAEDLGDYAGRVYDYHQANPHFARLLTWEGLQEGTQTATDATPTAVAAQTERAAHYAEKVRAVSAAQEAGALSRAADPAQLMFAVIALVNAWLTYPQIHHLLRAAVPDRRPATDREALALFAARLTTA